MDSSSLPPVSAPPTPPPGEAHSAVDRRRRGVVLTVLGTSGGVGASTLAAAVGVRAAAAGRTACVVDLDVLGGGLDVVFGLEQAPGIRWADLRFLEGEADGVALLPALPATDGVRVLAHGRRGSTAPPEVVATVLDGLAATVDVLVLDLADAAQADAQSRLRPDLLVLLAGTHLPQVAALTAVEAHLDPVWRGPRVVVLRRDGPARGARDAEADLADLADLLGEELHLPVAGVLSGDRAAVADLVHGVPPATRRGPLAEVAELLLLRALESVSLEVGS